MPKWLRAIFTFVLELCVQKLKHKLSDIGVVLKNKTDFEVEETTETKSDINKNLIFVDTNSNLSSLNLSKEQLLEQLKQNTISCKEVTFRFLGLSLASINTIFSLILSCIFFLKFKKYENNK